MNRICLLVAIAMMPLLAEAQRTVPLRNLWAPAKVHVMFGGYKVSFSIKDINRALELLAETGDSTYGITSNLDTAREYILELFEGRRHQYQTDLQPLLQNGVGTFLLTAGHAEIENEKRKKLKEIIMDIQPLDNGEDMAYIVFYDPKTHAILFSGTMARDMYKKDLGID